jgi:hypothetical protein
MAESLKVKVQRSQVNLRIMIPMKCIIRYIHLLAAAVLGGRYVGSAPSETDASLLLLENLVVSGVPSKRNALVVAGAMSSIVGSHYKNAAELYSGIKLKGAPHRVCANTVSCFTLFSPLYWYYLVLDCLSVWLALADG